MARYPLSDFRAGDRIAYLDASNEACPSLTQGEIARTFGIEEYTEDGQLRAIYTCHEVWPDNQAKPPYVVQEQDILDCL